MKMELKFQCEICQEIFDGKRQRECKLCGTVVCEYCLNEDGVCEKCAE
jgi:hypothetical protein